mmetsp:Transcript_11696/g.24114  ORF Transcript_11696/g.24114 Transcript_11696/m.24114 type:complete len:90 (-) Transcript_11696:313-582(-)
MYEDDNNEKIKYTHEYCKMIALKLHSRSDFPVECMKYEDAATILHEKNEAYVGMSPGEKIDAMRAKDEGHLNGAQIKRRMTTKNAKRFY